LALLPGLLALVPHLAAHRASAPPERVFLGSRYQSADFAQYLAFARHAQGGGGLAAPNPFVTDAQDGRVVLLFPWLVGQVARLTGADLVVVWYALGTLASWAFFLVAWLWIRSALEGSRARAVAFVLTSLGAGLEWLPIALGAERLERALEVQSFWNWSSAGAAQIPMWTLSYGLALGAWLLCANPGRIWRPWIAGALVFAAHLVHPYTGLAALAVLGALAAVPLVTRLWGGERADADARAAARRALIAFASGAVLAGAQVAWAFQDPVFAKSASEALRWKAHFDLWWYPLLYGVPLFLAFWGLRRFLAEPSPAHRPVWVAALVVAALSSFPFAAGVKFQYLLHLPLAILAAAGLEWAGTRWGWPNRRSTLALITAFSCVGTPLGLTRDAASAGDDRTLYARQKELDLLAALDRLPGGGVLASRPLATAVPWKAGKPVHLGHWFLSYDGEGRARAEQRFWTPAAPLYFKRQFLEGARIRYAVLDARLAAAGARMDPGLGAREVFRNEAGTIYDLGRPGERP
jgi:hypothetical protein